MDYDWKDSILIAVRSLPATIVHTGREHNFNKYDNRTVTDYGIGYDYESIMHYSSYAFSKNGEPTITPKVSNRSFEFLSFLFFFLLICSYKLYLKRKKVKLGQRKEFSEKDMLKLREMYKEECGKREMNGTADNNSTDDISIEWILSNKL